MKRIFFMFHMIAILGLCSVLQAQDDRFVVFQGGKHGYIDRKGKLVIQPNLEGTYVIYFSEELAAFAERVKSSPTRVPYVDKNGKLRLFAAEKWGFIDTNGAIAIAAQFDAVGSFSEGLAAVAFDTPQTRYDCTDCDPNQSWGFINKQGQMVIQPRYHSVGPFSEGLAAVQNDSGKWGYIDSRGVLVIPFTFEYAGKFSEGLADVRIGKNAGYINQQGSFAIPPRFTLTGRFSEGLAAVRTGGKTSFLVLGPSGGRWSIIAKDGSTKIKLGRKLEHVGDFHEGLAAIQKRDGRCGYVNTAGRPVIATQFSYCDDFSEGLACVLLNGKWQCIDKGGRVVLALTYSGVHSFKNGLAAVEEGDVGPQQRFGYIDKRGNQVWTPRPAL